jgi:hypothetical protein
MSETSLFMVIITRPSDRGTNGIFSLGRKRMIMASAGESFEGKIAVQVHMG